MPLRRTAREAKHAENYCYKEQPIEDLSATNGVLKYLKPLLGIRGGAQLLVARLGLWPAGPSSICLGPALLTWLGYVVGTLASLVGDPRTCLGDLLR